MTGTDLFAWGAARQAEENAPGLARADHPDTSVEAANAIAPVSGKRRIHVLRMLSAVGSATAEYLEKATGLPGNTVRPRLVELREKGHVVVAEGHGTTFAGHRARLYSITPMGRTALQHIDRKQAEQ